RRWSRALPRRDPGWRALTDDAGRLGDRQALDEEHLDRQLDLELALHHRQELDHGQRLAAQLEEVLVSGGDLDAEDLGPQPHDLVLENVEYCHDTYFW